MWLSGILSSGGRAGIKGRINFGWNLYDPKGVYGKEVEVSGQPLTGQPWSITRLRLEGEEVKAIISHMVERGDKGAPASSREQPRFFYGSFMVDTAVDTYLDMRPWSKGVSMR